MTRANFPYHLFLILLILLVGLQCKSKKIYKYNEAGLKKIIVPPGTVKIDDTLYADTKEISVIDYLEYLDWLSTIFGSRSQRYRIALPDTNVWLKDRLDQLSISYLRSPAFTNYPIVGLSYEQATEYAKWRSDRVYEMMLGRRGLISPSAQQDSLSYFTRESYLAGRYKGVKPDSTCPIPQYRLPTPEEWKYLAELSYDPTENRKIYTKEEVRSQSNYQQKVLFTTKVQQQKPNSIGLHHLLGNVAEMTSEKGIAKGGSWIHEVRLADAYYDFKYTKPGHWLGLRCVCTWLVLKNPKEIIDQDEDQIDTVIAKPKRRKIRKW